MTPQLHDPGQPAPTSPPRSSRHEANSLSTRTRARVGAAALVAAGLAVSACAATTTQSTASGSVTTRAKGPIELAINADVAALGKVVGDFAPEQTTTTKPAGPGEPGGTESTIPGDTVPTTPPTVAPTLPPVTPAPTRPPPVVTTQTFNSNPNNNSSRPQPSPFNGDMSANENKVYQFFQAQRGPITLDAGLMQGARAITRADIESVPPKTANPANAPGTFTYWVGANTYGNGTLEGVFNDGITQGRFPTDGAFTHAGISAFADGTNFYVVILVARQ